MESLSATRISSLLKSFEALYPSAWNRAEGMRADRGIALPKWEKWCYLPFAGWIAIASGGCAMDKITIHHAAMAAILAALGSWRVSKGIYRFDETLYREITETHLDGIIPCEVLYRLPEWCVYIETPGLLYADEPVYGFFAHLEHDQNDGRHELRILLHLEENCQPMILHLGDWTVEHAVRRAVSEGARLGGMTVNLDGIAGALKPIAEKVVSLVLYLCSANAEILEGERLPPPPGHRPKRDAVPLKPVTLWEVGERIGAAIRRGKEAPTTAPELAGTGTGTPKRPHVRRAHWHGYWTGPIEGPRMFSLKWLPPIPVNIDPGEENPAVIHPVRND
jgi:hypothetical protein